MRTVVEGTEVWSQLDSGVKNCLATKAGRGQPRTDKDRLQFSVDYFADSVDRLQQRTTTCILHCLVSGKFVVLVL